jgi:hypothetical protein
MWRLVVALAAFLVLGGHAAEDDTSHKLSTAQLESLATEIMRHTPEYLHYVEGTTFSWVLFTQETEDSLPGLTAAVLSRLRKKYTVYRSKEDVPSTELILDRGGSLLGYRDGFLFHFTATILGESRVEVRYSDWEGNLSASSQTVLYEWTGSRWKVIEKGPLVVS